MQISNLKSGTVSYQKEMTLVRGEFLDTPYYTVSVQPKKSIVHALEYRLPIHKVMEYLRNIQLKKELLKEFS